ncbi:DMT family transporter [Nonomuraea sp. LPB2021202275-12-8]|uniref:DMT family transporter n=1 Tax=Nonomuraea sp. LPB2021202275-12-8 TaxID=3120159 RepID=UPI00300C76B2
MTDLSTRRATLYVATAAAAWGTGGAAGSLLFASGGLDPLDVSFWRYLLGAAFLLPLSKPRIWRVNRRVALVGIGMAVYQTAYFAAIAESGVAVATVVTMGATPLFTALGSRFLLGERLGGAGLLALVTALTGLLLLTGEAAVGTAGSAPAGVGLALLSAAGYAAVTLFSRRHHDDPEGTAVGGFVVGAICLAPFALAGGMLPEASWESVGLLLYLGAVPTALAYALFFRALTALSATTVSIVSLGEAAGAAVLGVVLFGERLTPVAWFGCVLLLLAMMAPAVLTAVVTAVARARRARAD